jgi:hypothetical protein
MLMRKKRMRGVIFKLGKSYSYWTDSISGGDYVLPELRTA